MTNYWDTLYAQQRVQQASWFEPQASASLRLFAHTDLPFDAPILDVGSGLSPFLNELLNQGYLNLIATDLSATALDQHRRHLSPEQASRVLWVVDDVTAPQHLPLLNPVLLWHDRALLHGLTSAAHTQTYIRLLNHMVEAHGWVILGVRSPQPAPPLTDAGLLVQAYDVAGLVALLGANYQLRHTFDEAHETPQGQQQGYTYALFQRNATSRNGLWD
ncbi:class I SAM-dependent methyltransferase [Hymenobacter sp. ISL-91]|nr:class I SAM-dependent methyltransferase [Hymenobacter sp. ISL-91]